MADPDLWTFALQCWKRPGVEKTALDLQDRWQLSVSLLLAGLWLGRKGLSANSGLAERLHSVAAAWESERIGPLRGLRRSASGPAGWADWRRLLQEAELEAERLLLVELQALTTELPLSADSVSSVDAWLLLLVPDMASCEELAAGLAALRDACDGC